mmetsp:Transcript_90358/g.156517  ORF Transcript_90358/g.156517 Transcript_90358/m.156517 type:complete len:85 (+) Transcript_90358:726-980(+)
MIRSNMNVYCITVTSQHSPLNTFWGGGHAHPYVFEPMGFPDELRIGTPLPGDDCFFAFLGTYCTPCGRQNRDTEQNVQKRTCLA